MRLEQNIVSLGLLLLAIVVSTTVGGLVGRRIRVIRERRAGRRSTATGAGRGDQRSSSHAASVSRPVVPVVTPSQSAVTRPLSGGPPPVATRRPLSLSPALASRGAAPTATGPTTVVLDRSAAGSPASPAASVASTTSGGGQAGRGRRVTLAGLLAGPTLVLALLLATGGIPAFPRGAVLDATATPDPALFQAGATPAGSPSDAGSATTAGEPPRHAGRHRRAVTRVPGPASDVVPDPSFARPIHVWINRAIPERGPGAEPGVGRSNRAGLSSS